ncbi:MAG: ATP-dependent sacrificial sulfur transferase LarE [Nitrospira sp.]|nr:ATP-dependent sacrificial sulfur transferase LarE [Nitrospira sp.]
MLSDKLNRMQHLLREMESVLVAYSGGIDSTLVLKVAHETLGSKAVGVTAVSPTLPSAELEAARLVAVQIGVRHLILETDQLEISDFVRNDATRCYHCKTDLYQGLAKLRQELTLGAIVDGTNLDDLDDDRPGLLAAREWGVRSPLVEASLSKDEVRALAKELGLSNWDKPAAACLSSRIARGVPITREQLHRVEQAEAVLLQEGFKQVRVRDGNGEARVEVGQDELAALFEPAMQARITNKLRTLGFEAVTLDRRGYRRDGGNS